MDTSIRPLVISGVNAVTEMLKTLPGQVMEVMIAQGAERANLRAVIQDARRYRVPVRYVDSRQLDAITDGASHQGVAATTAAYRYFAFSDLLQTLRSAPARVLVLDGVTDPRNFGALLRCAEGAGIRHVVVPKDRSAGVTAAVVKTSVGAVNYLKIYRVPNLTRALQELKQAGCWIVGLDAAAPECIYDRTYPEATVVVLGSESRGIRPLVRRECDFLASIPMLGKVRSLNVSVAGGVFLYELVRQRR